MNYFQYTEHHPVPVYCGSTIMLSFCLVSPGHDWSSYIRYVVRDLEGDTAEDAEQRREQELREKITDITSCNIRAESFLDAKTETSKFDVVHTNLCLEIACESYEEFCKCLGKLGDLLKPGGYFVMLTAKGGAWYTCAGAGSKLFQLKLEEEDILKAVELSGMCRAGACRMAPPNPATLWTGGVASPMYPNAWQCEMQMCLVPSLLSFVDRTLVLFRRIL